MTVRPTPDPTQLTTEATARAVAAVRDYVDGVIAVVTERLRGIDRATQLLNETVNRVPTDVQKEVSHLRELMDERSQAVVTQFELIERQRVEQKADTDKAVQAALSAAKEAVKEQTTAFGLATAKSETSFAEQLKQLTVTFNTAMSGMESAQRSDRTRIERIENVKTGGKEAYGVLIGVVGLILTLLLIGGAALALTNRG